MQNEKLAFFGGKPIIKDHALLKIDWPIITEDDEAAVINAFRRRDFSGRGSEEIYALEKEMANAFDMPYATALNSGTAALHAALVSLGVGEKDEVIVPNLTFIASAMAIVQNRSTPIFADIDPVTYNITEKTIKSVISKKTKAIIVVHMHGIPADMDPILKLAKEHGISIIEDVAQSPGATYKGKKVGSFGDASIFSLMSQKNLATCGECGILLNREITQKNKAEMLRIYGEVLKPQGPRAYNSFTFGWNYTLNPIQAAMARVQLKNFKKLTEEIQQAGKIFNKKLSRFPWVTAPFEDEDSNGVFHFYRVALDPSFFGYQNTGRFRKAVQDILNAEGLNVRHYQNTLISEQPYFQTVRLENDIPGKNNFPNTLNTIRSTLVIGAIGSSPAYLLCPGTIDKYISGFSKIEMNINEVLAYAESLDYKEPWDSIPVTSDSYKTKYEVLA